VAVRAGEALTGRQLLEAFLVPSGDNIAQMLAGQVAGGKTRFLAAMSAEARALGMDDTVYTDTDPSGLDPSTVSTAADQLRVQVAYRTNPSSCYCNKYSSFWDIGRGGRPGSDRRGAAAYGTCSRVTLAGSSAMPCSAK
jgi:D-alanyl-D-alanine carboxypeptidase